MWELVSWVVLLRKLCDSQIRQYCTKTFLFKTDLKTKYLFCYLPPYYNLTNDEDDYGFITVHLCSTCKSLNRDENCSWRGMRNENTVNIYATKMLATVVVCCVSGIFWLWSPRERLKALSYIKYRSNIYQSLQTQKKHDGHDDVCCITKYIRRLQG